MEASERRIFPKPKKYTPMAHEIANPRDMAHWIDFPESFKVSFAEKAEKVNLARSRKLKIDALSDFVMDLNEYTRQHGISQLDIRDKKRKKADKNGAFRDGQVLITEDGEKLVRDNIPKIYKENKYRKVTGRKEFLDLLGIKLIEEAKELMDSGPDSRLEEVADVNEVIYTIMQQYNIDPDEVILRVQSKEVTKRSKENRERRKLSKKK